MSDYIQSGFVIVPGLVKKIPYSCWITVVSQPVFVDNVFIVVACVDFDIWIKMINIISIQS